MLFSFIYRRFLADIREKQTKTHICPRENAGSSVTARRPFVRSFQKDEKNTGRSMAQQKKNQSDLKEDKR